MPYEDGKIENILADALPEFVSQAERKAQDGISPGDFIGDDGLVYCGVCKKPKQFRVNLLGWKTVSTPCDCEQARIDNAEMEYKANQRSLEISRSLQELRDEGVIDSRLTGCRFADDDRKNPKQSDLVMRYVEQFEKMKAKNIGLLMYGGVGTGKTFLAGCIADALLKKGYFVISSSIATIASAMRRNYGADEPAIRKRLANCDLLILDDFGTQRSTEAMNEQVYTIIDTRYNVKKPIVITTNLTYEELAAKDAPMDKKRVYDRLMEMCTPIAFNGKSRRQEIKREKQDRFFEIFAEDDEA